MYIYYGSRGVVEFIATRVKQSRITPKMLRLKYFCYVDVYKLHRGFLVVFLNRFLFFSSLFFDSLFFPFHKDFTQFTLSHLVNLPLFSVLINY